jgi:hypothetical protein
MLIKSPQALSLLIPADTLGNSSLPVSIPNQPALHGFRLSLQSLAIVNNSAVASNGLELSFCR